MNKFATAALSATLFAGLLGIATTGCETSHSTSDKTTLLGGQKHEETTTTKNPITGDTKVEHTESKNGGL